MGGGDNRNNGWFVVFEVLRVCVSCRFGWFFLCIFIILTVGVFVFIGD